MQKFHKMAQGARGEVPLSVIKPQHALSSDDTVTFVFAGTEKQGAARRLVGVKLPSKAAGANSKHQ